MKSDLVRSRFNSSPASDAFSRDDVFDLLGNRRRRYILYYLQKSDEPVDVEQLAKQVAAWIDDVPVTSISERTHQSVYVSLYQSHLPKLDEAGVVEYDQSNKLVRSTDRFAELKWVLDAPSTRDWSQHYFTLAVFNVVVVLANVTNVPPFSVVPLYVFAVLSALTFGVVSLVHLSEKG